MSGEEFSHFGYLFEKAANQFRKGEEPVEEVFFLLPVTDSLVMQYLFERWRRHVTSFKGNLQEQIKVSNTEPFL